MRRPSLSPPMSVLGLRESVGHEMAFNIEITPRNDATGATVYAVVVTIDDHETIVSFQSREAAERFAETERARLVDDAQRRAAPD